MRIVKRSEIGGLDQVNRGRMRCGKPISRAHDRLIDTTQTAWGRCRDSIRNPWVHDHAQRLSQY